MNYRFIAALLLTALVSAVLGFAGGTYHRHSVVLESKSELVLRLQADVQLRQQKGTGSWTIEDSQFGYLDEAPSMEIAVKKRSRIINIWAAKILNNSGQD